MENYRKARTVEQPSLCPFPDLPSDTAEVRVKDGSKIRNLMRFALSRMEEKTASADHPGPHEGPEVILLIAFLCVHYEHRRIEYSAFHYFEVVTAWFLIVFSIFFLMHLFRLQSKITCINWTLTEFLHYAVGGILVFIASIVVAVKSYGVSALIAGSVFGFIATFLIAISIWTSYKVTCGSQPTGAAV
uniref:CKLF-like MARVEL transmembrane domain-containing protein 7 n=1 Tax=Sinocyclocheilus grahami TaxID=75366 RepID=A0A672KND4_SINGR